MLRSILVLLALLSAVPAARGDAAVINFESRTLPNGLRVVTHEDFSCPVVAVQVWYHVGSKDEEPQRQGFAHLFEHMMFRGTDLVAPDMIDKLTKRVGGMNNAYTSFDNTTYVNRVPADQLEMVLWYEAERMAFLRIDEEAFFTERAVVEEERRQGLNAPYGTVLERLMPQIYAVHPYRWTPIGQIPHLRAATVDELARFWERYYVPNNATLVIAGAVKHGDAQALAERYFAWAPRGEDPPRVDVTEPPQEARRVIRIPEKKGPLTIAGLGYRTVGMGHPDALPLELLMLVLGGGESSRIYVDLVKDADLAVAAGAETFTLEQDGLAGAYAVIKPLGSKQKALERLAAQVERVRAEPIAAEELERAKMQYRRSLTDAMTTVEGKARLLGEYAVLRRDLPAVNRRFERLDAVTPEDLHRVAREHLQDARQMEVMVEPSVGEMLKGLVGGGDADEGAAPAKREGENRIAERRGPKATARRPDHFPRTPPLREIRPEFPTPATVERTLSGGLRVVVVPSGEVPLVTLALGLRHGASTDAAVGAASLAAATVTQGTARYTATELARELESHGVTLAASVDLDAGVVRARALSHKADEAVRLLAEVARRPTFPEKDIEQVRQQTLSGLLVSEQSADYVADREMKRRLFAGHPYARNAGGDSADVQALRRDDVAAWWARHVRPDTSVLYIAGDIAPEAAFDLAAQHFGDWTADGAAPAAEPPAPPSPPATHIVVVDRPGSVQSEIRVGALGIERRDPDWPAARVFTQVFGAGFDNRLVESLRVRQGLTYGAGGGFRADRFAGSLSISTFTKTPTTAATVRAILDVLASMRDGVTPEELDSARSYLLGAFALQRETPESAIDDLWLIEYAGLPADYLQGQLRAIAATSEQDVARVARRRVDAGALVIVVVGEASAIAEELRAIAPVTVVPAGGAATRPAGSAGE